MSFQRTAASLSQKRLVSITAPVSKKQKQTTAEEPASELFTTDHSSDDSDQEFTAASYLSKKRLVSTMTPVSKKQRLTTAEEPGNELFTTDHSSEDSDQEFTTQLPTATSENSVSAASKKSLSSTLSKKSATASTSKKRAVSVKTVQNWISQNDKQFETASWLKYDVVNREHVSAVKCSVCIRFQERIYSCRNYNSAFITGSTNLRCSAFKDHAVTEMHRRAMNLFRRSQCQDEREYNQRHAPIARALLTIDVDTAARLKNKFELTYFLCKESIAFKKMASLCELEEKHGVDLGSGYKNNQACSVFVKYIAQDFRQQLANTLTEAKFFSLQADGSTDAGKATQCIIDSYLTFCCNTQVKSKMSYS